MDVDGEMTDADKRHIRNVIAVIKDAKHEEIPGVIWGQLPEACDHYAFGTSPEALTDYFHSRVHASDDSYEEDSSN